MSKSPAKTIQQDETPKAITPESFERDLLIHKKMERKEFGQGKGYNHIGLSYRGPHEKLLRGRVYVELPPCFSWGISPNYNHDGFELPMTLYDRNTGIEPEQQKWLDFWMEEFCGATMDHFIRDPQLILTDSQLNKTVKVDGKKVKKRRTDEEIRTAVEGVCEKLGKIKYPKIDSSNKDRAAPRDETKPNIRIKLQVKYEKKSQEERDLEKAELAKLTEEEKKTHIPNKKITTVFRDDNAEEVYNETGELVPGYDIIKDPLASLYKTPMNVLKAVMQVTGIYLGEAAVVYQFKLIEARVSITNNSTPFFLGSAPKKPKISSVPTSSVNLLQASSQAVSDSKTEELETVDPVQIAQQAIAKAKKIDVKKKPKKKKVKKVKKKPQLLEEEEEEEELDEAE